MLDAVQKVINIANSEIGYMEKNKGQNLDPKTPGGDGNYTKYARDVKHQNGLPWCQTWIAAILTYAFGRDIANKLLNGMVASASTMDVKDKFAEKKQIVEVSKSKAGDIMYRSRSGGGHVGYCVEFKNGNPVTVEGNTSSTDATSWNGGMVARHTNGSWMWAARPDYSIVTMWDKQPNNTWMYFLKGDYVKDKWLKIDNKWYVFDKSGTMITGWFADNGWYYLGPDGAMYSSQWINYKNKDYYLMEDGKMAVNSYVKSSNKNIWYWINGNGEWDTSKDVKIKPASNLIVK